jgi:hypothetical protein
MMKTTYSVKLVDEATATGYGIKHQSRSIYKSFQAYGSTSAGTGLTQIRIQVSNLETPDVSTDVDWVTLNDIWLSLSTTRVSDSFSDQGAWRHVRGKVVSISGTGAIVTLLMAA